MCGLKWSPDCRLLASGGNDNVVNIWSVVPDKFHSQSTPMHTFTDHQAAVKVGARLLSSQFLSVFFFFSALAWCPWQPSILASGGGTADRHIRLWNCNTGALMSSTHAESQVSLVKTQRKGRATLALFRFPLWPGRRNIENLSPLTVIPAMPSPSGNTEALRCRR